MGLSDEPISVRRSLGVPFLAMNRYRFMVWPSTDIGSWFGLQPISVRRSVHPAGSIKDLAIVPSQLIQELKDTLVFGIEAKRFGEHRLGFLILPVIVEDASEVV